MIKLFRVDHRLLHGQVAVGWVNHTEANCILIANDDVSKNDMWKTTLRLAKPTNCKLVIKNIEDAIESLNNRSTDKYNLIILVENLSDAAKIALNDTDKRIQSINLGGAKHTKNSRAIGKSFYITDEDTKYLSEILSENIEVEVRQLPNENKIIIDNINVI